jgi:hypothetical protein
VRGKWRRRYACYPASPEAGFIKRKAIGFFAEKIQSQKLTLKQLNSILPYR